MIIAIYGAENLLLNPPWRKHRYW